MDIDIETAPEHVLAGLLRDLLVHLLHRLGAVEDGLGSGIGIG